MLKYLSALFGSKGEVIPYRESCTIFMPLVEQIKAKQEILKSYSDQELRDQTAVLREKIKRELAIFNNTLQLLQKELTHRDLDIAQKNERFLDIEAVQKDKRNALESVLNELLVHAFAVVRETARRLKENGYLEVLATDHDRSIAENSTYVKLSEVNLSASFNLDQALQKKNFSRIIAIWQNEWNAHGKSIHWDMEHFDVQLMGGIALHQGKIAEMDNGEGKTLMVTLPAYLNALAGEGVHIVTANEYLAQRDAAWMKPLFEFHGLKVGCLTGTRPHSPERKTAYEADITYGTIDEFGFDYLRDNMVIGLEEVVQRPLHFAILDEADFILIEESRTPLIMSGPDPKQSEKDRYAEYQPFVRMLVEEQMNLVNDTLHDWRGLAQNPDYSEGVGQVAAWLEAASPKHPQVLRFLHIEGVQSKKLNWLKNKKYNQVQYFEIIDQNLYFKFDNDLTVTLTDKGRTRLAELMDVPDFFNIPDIIEEIDVIDQNFADLSEERLERKKDLLQLYQEKSEQSRMIEQLVKANTIFNRDDKYILQDEAVVIIDEKTGRTSPGRRYSQGLHQAIEAKEGVTIGDLTQTYAQITIQQFIHRYHKLGGMTATASTEWKEFWEIYRLKICQIPPNKPVIRSHNEDKVYKTRREKFNAILENIAELHDAQRPILVGTTSVEESETFSRMLYLRGLPHEVLNAKNHFREAQIIGAAGKPGSITISTNMAGRGTDIQLTQAAIDAGGLAVIGTERHDARRLDKQLVGRAGRQGRPGSAQFYVCLDDPLMRLFQSERIANLMDQMGHREGDLIQHSMVTKSIERAQKKVEENNFGIRTRLYEYDAMLNIQREAIYDRRSNIIRGDRLDFDIMNIFYSVCEQIQNTTDDSLNQLTVYCRYLFGQEPDINAPEFCRGNPKDQVQSLFYQMYESYLTKMQQFKERLLPIINDVHSKQGTRYKKIVVPIVGPSSFGLNISANMERAIQSNGESIRQEIAQTVCLAFIDDAWKKHLKDLDELKDDVQAVSMTKLDPLLVFKKDAFEKYQELVNELNQDIVRYLCTSKLSLSEEEKEKPNYRPMHEHQWVEDEDMPIIDLGTGDEDQGIASEFFESVDLLDIDNESDETETSAHAAGDENPDAQQDNGRGRLHSRSHEKVIGRNDPCPCGSGKKYKHCHGTPG